MRDDSNCPFGKSCRFSHDPKDLKEAREKKKASQAANQQQVDAAKGGKGKGEGKGKGKGRGCGSRSQSRQASPAPSAASYPRNKVPEGVCNCVWQGKRATKGASASPHALATLVIGEILEE